MKRALVTGATTLIAHSAITELLESGWWVVAVSQRQPKIDGTDRFHFHEVDDDGGVATSKPRYHWHAMDLSDPRYRYALVNAVRQQPIDLLVHCSLPTLLQPVLEELGDYARGAVVMSGFEFTQRGGVKCLV